MIFVETVYSKTGKKVGINYIGMEVTDQVSLKNQTMLILISYLKFLFFVR